MFLDRLIPAALQGDPETARKARMIVRFGFWGAGFGALYVVFYLAIGHPWGALVVALCSGAFVLVPVVLRSVGSLGVAANALSAILFGGFCALSAIEGGIQGHAVAWLVGIPLCALLLGTQRAAFVWAFLCLAAAGVFAGLHLAGVEVPRLYPARWEGVVTGAGYLSLILFLFGLGLIFERSREQAMNAMAEANAELSRLNREKSEFLGIAAHDLKNPLSVVLGYAELIRDQSAADRPETAALSREILDASERMLRLVRDLLDVNAIEEGRIRYDIGRCDFGEIVSGVVATYRRPAWAKQIAIEWHAPAERAHLRADARFVLQIVDNLLSNAVKYSPPGRPVLLRIRDGGEGTSRPEGWTLDVADLGPGLGEEDQGKLFGKFERLTPQPTGGESSNGLGLSIVRRIAREMGGDVLCRSALG
ncbi:MAG TPA: HAMP domain-containing sensor histidine kinase, partial [Candidatus Methylacidiphilales bacterium]